MTDDLIERLRALPLELPSPVDRLDRVRGRVVRRRRRRSTAAAASVVAVIVAVPWVWGSVKPAPDPLPAAPVALDCPQIYDGALNATGWLPTMPTFPEADLALVPPGVPLNAVVCSYAQEGRSRGWDLTSTRDLGVGLDRLAVDLGSLPEADEQSSPCLLREIPHMSYLVGLSYGSGPVWVSTQSGPGACQSTTTNGALYLRQSVEAQAASAVELGRWGATTDASELVGQWRAVSVPGFGGDLSGGFLSFGADGRLLSPAAPNFCGRYTLTSNGRFHGALSPTPGEATAAIACPLRDGWDAALRTGPITHVVEAAESVTVADGTLTLYDADNAVLAVFEADSSVPPGQPATSDSELLGKWRPTWIKGFDGDLDAEVGQRPKLRVKQGGLLGGYDGCNWIYGHYRLSRSGAFTGKAGTTFRGCIPHSGVPIVDAVWHSRSVLVEGDQLTLLDTDGQPLATFTRAPN